MIRIILLYIGIVGLIVAAEYLYIIGETNLKRRAKLAYLAIIGEDYSKPAMPMGHHPPFETHKVDIQDDPKEAYLLLGSDAERRYWAFTKLLENNEFDWDIEDELRRGRAEARNEAVENIRLRAESRTVEEEFNTRMIIKDPVSHYTMQQSISRQQQVRGNVSWSNVIDRFAENLLSEVSR